MRQSIASYFNSKKEQEKSNEAIVDEAARNESTASSSSNGVLDGRSPVDGMEKNGMYKTCAYMPRVGNRV